MKKTLIKIIPTITIATVLFLGTSTAFAQTVLFPSRGGTGIGSVSASDINKCLKVTNNSPYTLAYGTCGGGGGSAGGTWSTTTSSVLSQLINYSNNDTDIVMVGDTSTSTAEFWLDPNLNRFIVRTGNVGIASSSPTYPLTVTGNMWLQGKYAKFGDSTSEYTCINLADACVELSGDGNTTGGVFYQVGNRNAGTSAYSGLTILNDLGNLGNNATYYAGLFLNSSVYSDPTFGTANNVPNILQLGNTMGSISIQASSTLTSVPSFIQFLAGGVNTTNEIARITTTGLGVGTTTPASKITTSVSGLASGIGNAVRTAPLSTANGIVGTVLSANASNVPFVQGIVHTTGATRALLLNPYGGNVGVGVDALPTGTLHVKSASESSSIILVSGPVNGVRLGTTASLAVVEGVDTTGSGSYQQLNVGGSSVALTTSGVERMRVTSTGVGIGTSTPSRALDVYGNTSFSNISGDNSLQIGNSAGVSFIQAANLLNTSTKNLALQVSGGNVGIGTSTPSSIGNLHVGAGTTGVNDTNVIIDSGSGTGAEPQLRFHRANVLKSAIYVKSDTEALHFYNGADRMVIESSGDIGISTSTPNDKLTVYGGGIGINPGGASRPTCTADNRGDVWNTFGGAGVADTFAVCQKDAADAYSWVTK